MTEQPNEASPFRPVKLAWPADGILPGSMEDVIGLTQTPRSAFGQLADAFMPIAAAAIAAPLVVDKLTAYVPYSRKQAEDDGLAVALGFREATPEERATAEARRAAWKADREARHTAAVAEWQQLCGRYGDSPAVLAVLDIHQPTPDGSLECEHPYFGYESSPEDWPCSTYVAIRDAGV